MLLRIENAAIAEWTKKQPRILAVARMNLSTSNYRLIKKQTMAKLIKIAPVCATPLMGVGSRLIPMFLISKYEDRKTQYVPVLLFHCAGDCLQ